MFDAMEKESKADASGRDPVGSATSKNSSFGLVYCSQVFCEHIFQRTGVEHHARRWLFESLNRALTLLNRG